MGGLEQERKDGRYLELTSSVGMRPQTDACDHYTFFEFTARNYFICPNPGYASGTRGAWRARPPNE